MNDPKDPKNLPPDDFSKTTPFIRSPKENYPSSSSSSREDYTSDWEKTNFNYSIPKTTPTDAPQPPADDWGKTAVNINLPQNTPPDDFNKTFMPGQTPRPSQPPSSGWDVTQNYNVPGGHEDFGGPPRSSGFEATTPFIQLPQSERAKYQNVSQAAAAPTAAAPVTVPEEKQEAKKAPMPAWVWFASVAGLFFLMAALIVGGYLIWSKRYGYDVIVKGAAPNSDVFVDNTRWGYTSPDGTLLLTGLGRGPHKIEIKHPQFTYEIEQVTGEDGDKTKEIVAKGRPKATTPPPTDECANATFKQGEFAKAAELANRCLDKLGDNFKPEDLLKAMNLYIINFDVNKFNIKPNDMKFLEKAAGYMKKLPPNTKVEVGGHTDSDGPDDKNQILSNNRAKAVRDALVGFGVNAAMLEERGYGESKPKAPNDTPDNKFQNRRIEYSLIIR